jgi:hypothetical protein
MLLIWIVDGLVIEHDGDIGVLKEGVSGKDSVVRIKQLKLNLL